jgi:hypothetical protein
MLLRRMLLVLAGLLAIAALASAIAPREPVGRNDETTPTVPAVVPPPTVRGRLPADRSVAAQVGDIVVLEVAVRSSDEVQIPDLGLDAAAEPSLPARFTFVADRPGRFPVRLRFADRRVGVLVVKEAP